MHMCLNVRTRMCVCVCMSVCVGETCCRFESFVIWCLFFNLCFCFPDVLLFEFMRNECVCHHDVQ